MTHMPAGERRLALIQAALRVVAERGVAAATTRAIVAEARMPLASFHYAFASRDELMQELVGYVVEQEEGSLLPAFAPAFAPTSIEQAVRNGLQHFFEGIKAQPMHEVALFELAFYAMRSPAMAALAAAQYERYYALAEVALETAARLTGSRWSKPVPEIARILVVLTDGLTTTWLAGRDDAAAIAAIEFAAESISRLAEPAAISAGGLA